MRLRDIAPALASAALEMNGGHVKATARHTSGNGGG